MTSIPTFTDDPEDLQRLFEQADDVATPVIDESCYTPEVILVTGGAGFIASHVVIHLVKTYPHYTIINFDKLDYCASIANLAEIEDCDNYVFIKGNILNAELLEQVFSDYKVDTLMHFAAQTHVDNSFGNSMTFTYNNILGTHVLLEAAKVAGISRFIHVSTDEVYGEIAKESDDCIEESVLEPTNPYAATKVAAEFLVKAYHRSFKFPMIITRGNNVFGPHQYPEKLVPKFICLLNRDDQVYIHGDGSNVRNFIYVSDVVSAFDFILHKGAIGSIYNIGTDCEKSVLDVTQDLFKLYGFFSDNDKLTDEQQVRSALQDTGKVSFVSDRLFNDARYAIDSSKLRNLGWEQKVSWEVGLKKTIVWYTKHANNWDSVDNALVAHPESADKDKLDEPNSDNWDVVEHALIAHQEEKDEQR